MLLKFFPLVVAGIALVTLVFFNNYRNYFKLIKNAWFFQKSWQSVLHFWLFLTSVGLLLVASLDLRDVPEKIEMDLPDQKTIIVIDSSSSMLVEDVRPNRFKKSLLLARHFIKKAAGHQVAVVLFSDTQKRLVPFTDDIDLLDARIASLESLDISKGGSNITQAIQESLQYLKAEGGAKEEPSGNILMFSDSEETDYSLKAKIPDGVSIAFVGVGTLRGGKIPLRLSSGSFYRYKSHKGKDVVSKLDENYIKKLGGGVKHFKYWVVSSYSLPTEEILEFFASTFLSKQKYSGQVVIRPVLSHYLVILAVILYIISAIFSQMRSFRKVVSIVAITFLAQEGFSPALASEKEQDEVEIKDKKTLRDMESLREGGLERIERLKLAERLLREEGGRARALKLYEETLRGDGEESPTALTNYGVALFSNGKLIEGLRIYEELFKKGVPEEVLRNNIMVALREMQNQEKNQGQDKQNKNKDKDQDQGKESSEKNENQSKSEKSDQRENKQKKEGEQKQEEEKEKEEQSKSEEEKKQDMKNEFSEREEEIKKKRKMMQIPAVLKQIMNEDRDLQRKYIDTRTRSKGKAEKDW